MLLATDVWVGALIRRAEIAGAFAMVARKGDARAGSVVVRAINSRTRRSRLYTEAFGADGERMWMEPVADGAEDALDRYVEKARRVDPDLWVVEIEDGEGRHFLTEPVAKP
ncbi:MAG TPA: DUF1491 family protein [Caulobacteraceae bacterium]|nr:DUF1491 family protein [Caulobacteraceae bacterium]